MLNLPCRDCGVNTFEISEYYMVHDELWPTVLGGREFLCLGCLEVRLNRRLTTEDFPDAPVNRAGLFPISDRMKNRLEIL